MSDETNEQVPKWLIFGADVAQTADGEPSPSLDRILEQIGPEPSWRRTPALEGPGSEGLTEAASGGRPKQNGKGQSYYAEMAERKAVSAALILRRPLLVTGPPGCGKSSLAYAVAHELGLEPVLHWPISSRTTVQDGLYHYDAIGRLQDPVYAACHFAGAAGAGNAVHSEQPRNDGGSSSGIERYLRLGPLGTAFFGRPHAGRFLPRVLLIDEVDKGDIDLPNDLLHLFEEQYFEIPELARLTEAEEADGVAGSSYSIKPCDWSHPDVERWRNNGEGKPKGRVEVPADGMVRCRAFPLIIMTSNGEREFPPAFQRRCLHLEIGLPAEEKLQRIIERHFADHDLSEAFAQHRGVCERLVQAFVYARSRARPGSAMLGSDQLLNVCQMVLSRPQDLVTPDRQALRDVTEVLWGCRDWPEFGPVPGSMH